MSFSLLLCSQQIHWSSLGNLKESQRIQIQNLLLHVKQIHKNENIKIKYLTRIKETNSFCVKIDIMLS